MAARLDGGCTVSDLREGAPTAAGVLRIWPRIGRHTGARAISLRIIEVAPGRSPGLASGDADDVCYVLSGRGTFLLDGYPFPVERDVGFYVPPRRELAIVNPGPELLLIASARCPEPREPDAFGPARQEPAPDASAPQPPPRVALSDRRRETTGDRWYCTLVGREQGSHAVTQFVGAIPPGRAPDHYHRYEEVLCVLAGTGTMWAGETSAPIAPGSCVYLPRGQVHCTENTGDGDLVLLGVFYPAGSPAVRYDVDGSDSSDGSERSSMA